MNRKLLLGLGAAALIVVAALLFLLSSGSQPTAAAGLISPAEYQSQFVSTAQTHTLIDVRTPEEFNSGHISGSINIAVETLSSRLAEVPRDQPIVVYCRSGRRSAEAAQILAQAGYTSISDLGGIQTWVAQGYPVQ